MELIESSLCSNQIAHGDLKEKLLVLRKFGLNRLIFNDYSSIRSFSQQFEREQRPTAHLYVISYPNRESIRMIWDILEFYDSFTLFIRHRQSARNYEYPKALYQAFSYTDNVGVAIDGEHLSTLNLDSMMQILQNEFKVNHVLILDRMGLILPGEIFNSIKVLRAKLPKGSLISYFPSDLNGLGMTNSFQAMKAGINGLVGSLFKKNCKKFKVIDFMKLHLLYQQEKQVLFSKRLIRTLDTTLEPFDKAGFGIGELTKFGK